jgi:hypothetical protein
VGLHACPLRSTGNCRKGQQEEPKEKAFSISSESGLSTPKKHLQKVQRELTEGERTSSQTSLKKERKTKKKADKDLQNGLQHQ